MSNEIIDVDYRADRARLSNIQKEEKTGKKHINNRRNSQ